MRTTCMLAYLFATCTSTHTAGSLERMISSIYVSLSTSLLNYPFVLRKDNVNSELLVITYIVHIEVKALQAGAQVWDFHLQR